MAHVLGIARELGRPESLVHREYFAAAPQQEPAIGGEFEIELRRSGRVLKVPKGARVVDVLWAAGVEVPVSCEQGVCGTLTRVVSGLPDHRDSFLTDDEQRVSNPFNSAAQGR